MTTHDPLEIYNRVIALQDAMQEVRRTVSEFEIGYRQTPRDHRLRIDGLGPDMPPEDCLRLAVEQVERLTQLLIAADDALDGVKRYGSRLYLAE
jgi:hypothetical protein